MKVSGASLDPDSGSDGGEMLPPDSETLETVGEVAGEHLVAESGSAECVEEKRVSFNEAICPLIDVISSTPCPGNLKRSRGVLVTTRCYNLFSHLYQ